MSEPEEEKPEAPADRDPSPWISREGDVVHPDAPAGGGGIGRFRMAGSLGSDGNDAAEVRHPRAPSVRFEALSGEEREIALDGGVKVTEPVRNAPPATATGEFALAAHPNPAKVEIKVKVQILADGSKANAAGDAGAQTRLDPSKVTAVAPPPMLPEDAPDPAPPNQKITGVPGKIVVEGTATLQVQYGADAKAKDGAAWGRGTTPDDVAKKDTTVGFHESCHLADYKTYLASTPMPIPLTLFNAKTKGEWDTAAKALDGIVEKYFADCEAASRTKTDEVGTKMSDYLKTHPNATGH